MNRKALIEVLTGKEPYRRPVWFMRQAGRYLPEYRAIRAKAGSFLSLCYDPKLACEVTLQPVGRFDLDAAIVFADILVVPHAMGLSLRFEDGEGPVIEKVLDRDAVLRLRPASNSEQVRSVCETVALVRAKLPSGLALIGFCGAPWTVASYLIEGGSSQGRLAARRVAAENPSWFSDLIENLVAASCDYLEAQIIAGADVVQIFDSWAGDLEGVGFDRWVIEPIRRIRMELQRRCGNVPVIVFARGAGVRHCEVAQKTAADAVSVEQGVDLVGLLKGLPSRCAVQGNLDPDSLLVGGDRLSADVEAILHQVKPERHIFNLGHGIRPETSPDNVGRVVEMVRAADARRDGRALSVA